MGDIIKPSGPTAGDRLSASKFRSEIIAPLYNNAVKNRDLIDALTAVVEMLPESTISAGTIPLSAKRKDTWYDNTNPASVKAYVCTDGYIAGAGIHPDVAGTQWAPIEAAQFNEAASASNLQGNYRALFVSDSAGDMSTITKTGDLLVDVSKPWLMNKLYSATAPPSAGDGGPEALGSVWTPYFGRDYGYLQLVAVAGSFSTGGNPIGGFERRMLNSASPPLDANIYDAWLTGSGLSRICIMAYDQLLIQSYNPSLEYTVGRIVFEGTATAYVRIGGSGAGQLPSANPEHWRRLGTYATQDDFFASSWFWSDTRDFYVESLGTVDWTQKRRWFRTQSQHNAGGYTGVQEDDIVIITDATMVAGNVVYYKTMRRVAGGNWEQFEEPMSSFLWENIKAFSFAPYDRIRKIFNTAISEPVIFWVGDGSNPSHIAILGYEAMPGVSKFEIGDIWVNTWRGSETRRICVQAYAGNAGEIGSVGHWSLDATTVGLPASPYYTDGSNKLKAPIDFGITGVRSQQDFIGRRAELDGDCDANSMHAKGLVEAGTAMLAKYSGTIDNPGAVPGIIGATGENSGRAYVPHKGYVDSLILALLGDIWQNRFEIPLNTIKMLSAALNGDPHAADNILAVINAHTIRKDNPHGTNKTHVGLSNVSNYAHINEVRATGSASATHLPTEAAVRSAIDAGVSEASGTAAGAEASAAAAVAHANSLVNTLYDRFGKFFGPGLLELGDGLTLYEGAYTTMRAKVDHHHGWDILVHYANPWRVYTDAEWHEPRFWGIVWTTYGFMEVYTFDRNETQWLYYRRQTPGHIYWKGSHPPQGGFNNFPETSNHLGIPMSVTNINDATANEYHDQVHNRQNSKRTWMSFSRYAMNQRPINAF
jgi:hypothetical protein